jgi:hypothetical protein
MVTGCKLMTKTDEHDALMAKLREIDFISCPRCDSGIYTDNEEGLEAFTLLGLPNLICPFCLLEYDLSVYLESDDND